MIKGFYAAASAMIAGLNRQTALTHNIDNLDTPGFKQILTNMDDYIETTVTRQDQTNGAAGLPAFLAQEGFNAPGVVGKLGLGVEVLPEKPDFSQGSLEITRQLLDVAIEGKGFFKVRTPSGDRYTRDGRFQRDSSGKLVTVDGYTVLGKGGSTIQIPDGVVSIAADGTITVDKQTAGQIDVVGFKDPEAELKRDLPNVFVAAGGATDSAVGSVQQGSLETSNVNAAQVMTQMIATTRAYEAAQQLVRVQDDLLGKSITTLGRL